MVWFNPTIMVTSNMIDGIEPHRDCVAH